MEASKRIGLWATVVDDHGRFVSSIGRVLDSGAVLTIRHGTRNASYSSRRLTKILKNHGLAIMFIPSDLRLPAAPPQLRDDFFFDVETSRIE